MDQIGTLSVLRPFRTGFCRDRACVVPFRDKEAAPALTLTLTAFFYDKEIPVPAPPIRGFLFADHTATRA